MSANYRDTSVDHKLYTFYGNARHYNRIGLIPRNQQVDFKYCETCNICYKKSYFNGHKKNKFHKEKQNVLDDARDKRLTEYSLSHTINHCLHIQLKNNDLNIGDIICDYLKAICNDCKDITSNPDGYSVNGEPINVCQHCRSKYKSCCHGPCKFIGTIKTFNHCENCKILGCKEHMKQIGKKYKCINCAHDEVDKLFVKEVTQNEEIKKMRGQIKSQREHMSYRAKKITEKSKEIKELKRILAERENDLNNIYISVEQMKEESMNNLRKVQEHYERKLAEQKI